VSLCRQVFGDPHLIESGRIVKRRQAALVAGQFHIRVSLDEPYTRGWSPPPVAWRIVCVLWGAGPGSVVGVILRFARATTDLPDWIIEWARRHKAKTEKQ